MATAGLVPALFAAENYYEALMIHNTRGYLRAHKADRMRQEQQGQQSPQPLTPSKPFKSSAPFAADQHPRRLLSCQLSSRSLYDPSRRLRLGPMDARKHVKNIADTNEQDPRHRSDESKSLPCEEVP
ncbi:unnamed protein product [Heligmosomoides polygyrus]|uniref:Uncharacterized protein n=1 Tax=Heligmosomoides polygyrus TaxID=6339 RepID=A0A183G0B3_HELPZ|nr:unnamed protein product [Heligmosomoides polygyrus]